MTGKGLQKLITIVATTDFLLFGYDQGVMSGIISAPAFTEDFPQVLDETYEGFVVSIYAVGCFLGALFILNFGDRLGRRNSIFLGAIIMIIGVVVQIAAVPPAVAPQPNSSSVEQSLVSETVSTPPPSLPTRPSAVSLTTVESSSASRAVTSPSER
ncbi:hypothetical protein NXS19_012781 [Fusarium pseudograminearum]|nr:hypothetical protein NXS19_012781 [Fusarium pseudograminearum]